MLTLFTLRMRYVQRMKLFLLCTLLLFDDISENNFLCCLLRLKYNYLFICDFYLHIYNLLPEVQINNNLNL